MNRKRVLLACVAGVVIVAVYALGRWSASGLPAAAQAGRDDAADAVPAAGTPSSPATSARPAAVKGGALPLPFAALKDTFAGLQARANAGDADAAKRLVRDLDRCSRLRAMQWNNSGTTSELAGKKTEGMNAAQLQTYQLLLDAMELRQQRARKDQDMCAGVDDEMLGTLVANIAQSARLGDEQARACYLGRGPLYDVRGLLDQPGALQGYRSDATAMIDAGLAAGDWRVVDLLQQAYEPGAQSLLAGMLGADPEQHYRYLKLYRLGAEPHRAAALDQRIAAVAAGLPPDRIYDADRWAQSTLKEHFSGNSTSVTPPGWETCSF